MTSIDVSDPSFPFAGLARRDDNDPETSRSRPTAQSARIDCRNVGANLWVTLRGQWTIATIDRLLEQKLATGWSGKRSVVADLSKVRALDTAGALLIHRAVKRLRAAGALVELRGVKPTHAALIEMVERNDAAYPELPLRGSILLALIERCGRATVEMLTEARDLNSFIGHTVIALGRFLPGAGRMRALAYHMEHAGLNALPIVGLLSFLVGLTLAFQSADQLAAFGAEILTVNLVGIGVLREMGVLLTAIIVAGRSGSAFTAQIGTMKLNEEVAAMQTIGLDPMDMLVLPRILALIVTLPLLTFYADIMGLLGGAIVATFVLDISPAQFAHQLASAVPIASFWVGIIKAPFFAGVIGLIGCFEGSRVMGSSESVGRLTTKSVVEAIFLVIVLDSAFSVLFSSIGI